MLLGATVSSIALLPSEQEAGFLCGWRGWGLPLVSQRDSGFAAAECLWFGELRSFRRYQWCNLLVCPPQLTDWCCYHPSVWSKDTSDCCERRKQKSWLSVLYLSYGVIRGWIFRRPFQPSWFCHRLYLFFNFPSVVL